MRRDVKWDGSCNARDLGGLRLDNGKRTIRGKLFRSGRIEGMTGDGWSMMANAGVTAIVDLRNAEEVGPSDADPDFSVPPHPQLDRFHCPIEDQANAAFMVRYGELLAHPAYYPGVFEFFPHLLGEAITRIVTTPSAVLFHCSAGRDRTGLIAALILRLNGVVIDDIAVDYESGVRGYATWQHGHPGQGRERMLSSHELDEAVAGRSSALCEWLDGIDTKSLLIDRLGLDTELIEHSSQLLHP